MLYCRERLHTAETRSLGQVSKQAQARFLDESETGSVTYELVQSRQYDFAATVTIHELEEVLLAIDTDNLLAKVVVERLAR